MANLKIAIPAASRRGITRFFPFGTDRLRTHDAASSGELDPKRLKNDPNVNRQRIKLKFTEQKLYV